MARLDRAAARLLHTTADAVDLTAVTALQTTTCPKRNATLVAVAANGETIHGSSLWRTHTPPKVNTQDGTFDIEFAGPSVTEATV